MTEKDIEAKLRTEIKKLGGTAYKFISPGNNGVPDRMICLPKGMLVFVELKAPGKYPTSLQQAQHKKLRALGFKVFGCVDSFEMVSFVIDYCRELMCDEV